MCGATPSVRPENWFAEYRLEVAHIASGQGRAVRVDDRRAVILACSRCHRLHVSDSDRHGKMFVAGNEYDTFDERHTLFVKRYFDKHYYDIEFLGHYWHGAVPSPETPPKFFVESLRRNQGFFL